MWGLPHAREALPPSPIKAITSAAMPLSHIAHACADKRVFHKQMTQRGSMHIFCQQGSHLIKQLNHHYGHCISSELRKSGQMCPCWEHMILVIAMYHQKSSDDSQQHWHWEHDMVSAGFGYCAQAAQAFVEEAAANDADVRYSEAVHDVRLEHSESGTSRLTGAITV